MASKGTVVIGTAVRSRWRQELWGDTHFARDVATALDALGWSTRVARYPQLERLRPQPGLVVLYLRGLRATPQLDVPTVTWLISHPDDFGAAERGRIAGFASASPVLAARHDGIVVAQATDPDRFRPVDSGGPSHDLLFVGNSRGRQRPVITHALALGEEPTVYGNGWASTHPELRIAGRSVANDDLHRFYATARVVLNDHWADMASAGIVSNRIFDVLASGGQVLTDRVADMSPELGRHVTVFDDLDTFRLGVERIRSLTLDERRARAEAARAWVLGGHTFAHRAVQLDELLVAALDR